MLSMPCYSRFRAFVREKNGSRPTAGSCPKRKGSYGSFARYFCCMQISLWPQRAWGSHWHWSWLALVLLPGTSPLLPPGPANRPFPFAAQGLLGIVSAGSQDTPYCSGRYSVLVAGVGESSAVSTGVVRPSLHCLHVTRITLITAAAGVARNTPAIPASSAPQRTATMITAGCK